MKDVRKYTDKKLEPLRSHLAPDDHAHRIGDVEVVDKSNNFFEGVEVKHNIPISTSLIIDSYEKLKRTTVVRFYLLTTAEPNIEKNEQDEIIGTIENIKLEHGCEVIVNGLIPSLKYYLRLIQNPAEFVNIYSKNLLLEFSKTTEIKKEHITTWNKIVKENFHKYSK
jgi:DNA (cytosine-5)-methyltransferase 1